MAVLFSRTLGTSDLVSLREKRPGKIAVRFLADSADKSVYVWDAESALHQQAAKLLGGSIQGSYYDISRVFTGTAELEGTSLTYKNSDLLDGVMRNGKKAGSTPESKFLNNLRTMIISNKELFASMYSFADKYIENATSFFTSIKA